MIVDFVDATDKVKGAIEETISEMEPEQVLSPMVILFDDDGDPLQHVGLTHDIDDYELIGKKLANLLNEMGAKTFALVMPSWIIIDEGVQLILQLSKVKDTSIGNEAIVLAIGDKSHFVLLCADVRRRSDGVTSGEWVKFTSNAAVEMTTPLISGLMRGVCPQG